MLTITILHYNYDALTDSCLDSIYNSVCVRIPFTIKVIDNGSELPYKKKAKFPGLEVVRIKENVGSVEGINLCFKHAESDLVLFATNDIVFLDDVINKLVMAETKHGAAQTQPAIIGPRHTDADNVGMNFLWPGYSLRNKKKDRGAVTAVTSTCFLMRKDIYNKIGPFDSSLKPSYQDIDYGLRVKEKGMFNLVVPAARVTYIGDQVLKKAPHYSRKSIHESRIKVIKKHYAGLDRMLRVAAVSMINKLTGV